MSDIPKTKLLIRFTFGTFNIRKVEREKNVVIFYFFGVLLNFMVKTRHTSGLRRWSILKIYRKIFQYRSYLEILYLPVLGTSLKRLNRERKRATDSFN